MINSKSVSLLSVRQKVREFPTHLDPKYFNLEVVDLLQPALSSDVSWFCGHANVNCDLEVVLLLANKSLVCRRVVEAFICVNVVGRRNSGDTGDTSLLNSDRQSKINLNNY